MWTPPPLDPAFERRWALQQQQIWTEAYQRLLCEARLWRAADNFERLAQAEQELARMEGILRYCAAILDGDLRSNSPA